MVDILILSAGKGLRVKNEIHAPKSLMEYDGNVALDYILEPFKNNKNFKINLNIRKDEEKYFEKYEYNKFVEEYPIGNAGAIKEYGKYLSDPFLVLHNDSKIINFNYYDLIKQYNFYKDKYYCFMIVVKNIAKGKENGIVVFDNVTDSVLSFTRERYVNCGAYCVGHNVFDYINDGFSDIDENLIKNLILFKRIKCFKTDNDYKDWGK